MKFALNDALKFEKRALLVLRTALAAAVSASLVAVAGCAAIPMSGTVRLGSDISSVSTNDFLYFSPYEPPAGGSLSDIMAGFLSAGTGPQSDYAVARMYLANNLKTSWMPNQRVVIADTTPEVTVDSANNLAHVQVHATAQIDEGGRLTKIAAVSNNTYDYSFTREGGQWRINGAPNLTIISRPVFDVVFKDFSLYFFDSQKRYLVPDVRWFPSRASTATRLVNALIAGPDSWLLGAAKNALPAGTKLAIDAVTITDGVASVDFNTKVLSASTLTKAQIQAQLFATLSQIPGVRSVQISVDRNIQDFGSFSPWDIPVLSLTPVVLTNSSLAHLSGNSTTAIDGTKTLVQHLKPKDFAITSQNNWVAATTKEGLYQASLVSFGAEPTLVDNRTDLLAPLFDRQGWLWSISAGMSPKILLFDQNGNKGELQTSVFAKKQILSFSVSPEGARLAVVIRTGKTNEAWLFGLIRDKSGAAVSISGGYRLATSANNPTSVSWLDGSTLGVLSTNFDGWAEPSELLLGGFETTLAGLNGGTSFIGSHSTDARFALTSSGELLQFRGSAWTHVQSGVLRVHYPN